ncbi:MAG TPA: DUF3574 domain-containing protein [Gemmatimonadaceae bacterium]|jgi:hypothetical protein|nr:DUF3574 domain-containing protein [Gemmatimonadaceae bacterium]
MRHLIVWAAAYSIVACAAPIHAPVEPSPSRPQLGTYVLETLFFGEISESDWQRFLAEEITPRFPLGLTVINANGQWQGPGGAIAHEASKVVMIVYANDDSVASRSAKIGTIDSLYKARFNQESVLRLRSIVQASF